MNHKKMSPFFSPTQWENLHLLDDARILVIVTVITSLFILYTKLTLCMAKSSRSSSVVIGIEEHLHALQDRIFGIYASDSVLFIFGAYATVVICMSSCFGSFLWTYDLVASLVLSLLGVCGIFCMA